MLQIRLLRKDPSTVYRVLLKYTKSFACQHSTFVTYLSAGDIKPLGNQTIL